MCYIIIKDRYDFYEIIAVNRKVTPENRLWSGKTE